jgi:hypothetical protein
MKGDLPEKRGGLIVPPGTFFYITGSVALLTPFGSRHVLSLQRMVLTSAQSRARPVRPACPRC